jgi:hypothetical protein
MRGLAIARGVPRSAGAVGKGNDVVERRRERLREPHRTVYRAPTKLTDPTVAPEYGRTANPLVRNPPLFAPELHRVLATR